MEVNRIARENPGTFSLDGVISVIDVENWKGYDDTSYTAKMQAKYTDLIVFNKWELVNEDAFERALDRVGDLEVQVAWVKSRKGRVEKDVVLGIDGAMVLKDETALSTSKCEHGVDKDQCHDHTHSHSHQDEVEVLNVALASPSSTSGPHPSINLTSLEDLLLSAPKDEVYRIKGLIASTTAPPDSTGSRRESISDDPVGVYVLNWAFSRWTYTQLESREGREVLGGAAARLTFVLARGESAKWKRKLEGGGLVELEGGGEGGLVVKSG